jgi:hypothetical protein
VREATTRNGAGLSDARGGVSVGLNTNTFESTRRANRYGSLCCRDRAGVSRSRYSCRTWSRRLDAALSAPLRHQLELSEPMFRRTRRTRFSTINIERCCSSLLSASRRSFLSRLAFSAQDFCIRSLSRSRRASLTQIERKIFFAPDTNEACAKTCSDFCNVRDAAPRGHPGNNHDVEAAQQAGLALNFGTLGQTTH